MMNVQQGKYLTELIDLYVQTRESHVRALCVGTSSEMDGTRIQTVSAGKVLTNYILSLTEKEQS